VTTTVFIGNYFEWNVALGEGTRYYYAGSARLAMRKGSGATAYFITDHLGSTNKLVDHTGAPLAGERQLYKPWGENRLSSLLTMTRYTYTSLVSDAYIIDGLASHGLYWMGARYYDLALGRFVSPDFVVPDKGNPQGFDRYAYVANNPISRIDTSGHCWGMASGIRGLPTYSTTCNNLDMALTIVQSDQATAGQKAGAIAYIGAEGLAHAALIVGSVACLSNVAVCLAGAKTALGIGGATAEAACADKNCTNELETAETVLNAIRNMMGNAKGTAYENWLKTTTGGQGSFTLEGAQFDNKVGNILMEAKSYNWSNFNFTAFQNQVGRASAIATRNGYQYVVHFLNKPPQSVIDWLFKQGIDYVIEDGAK
jgi:RHS repeat-associated protein